MSGNKQYRGYKAFQYLEAGVDYKEFELCAGDKIFPEYLIPLNAEQEKRVAQLAKETICISIHEHPTLFPKNMHRDLTEYLRQGREFCAYEELSRSYWDCVFDNMMDGSCIIHSPNGWKWSEVIHNLGIRLCDLAHQDFAIKCETVEDIYRAHREGKVGLVFVIEGAAPIENELDRLEILHGFGVRVLGITYNETNQLGSGLREEKDGGLTMFGRRAVERMNKIGMAIDCSHVGIETTKDVIAYSKKPIFMSHVGAKALWDTKRLTPDDVLKACADKGGVVGIEAAPHTTITKKHKQHSIYPFMEHFEYIKDLVGVDHVAFGPDTLYGDHVALHEATAARLSIQATQSSKAGEFDKVQYVKGIENPTEGSKNILRYLVREGYSDEEIGKFMGGNVIRLLKEVWV